MSIGDYHVHTRFSIDCSEEMEQQVLAAIERGITELAITEHVDHDTCDAESREHYNYQLYCEAIDLHREKYGDRIQILRAAEIDWNDTIADDVAHFVEDHDFDFIIGSYHNMNHKYIGFSTVEEMGGPQQMYDTCLDQMTMLVDTGFPSVIGHLDLARRYHRISMDDIAADHFEQRLRELFRLAATRGVGFEINTSGIRKGVGASHPEPEVIKWFVEEGGSVLTVGSDSHYAIDTGHSIPETYERLKAIGINWRSSFVGGEHKQVPLP